MQRDEIEQVRSFNRLITQRVGTLQTDYLARGRPFGEARLIFEIGRRQGADLQTLRDALELDSGYLSRLLRSLESQGLVEVGKAEGDGRARRATLTDKGLGEHRAYDSLSNALARSLLAGLNAGQRLRMVAAMAEVERLLRAGAIVVAREEPETGEARWCLGQYYAELAARFDDGFDQGKGNALSEAEMRPPAGYLLLARLDGAPVGCGVLKRLGDGICEVKRVWTASSARGLGVATKIMDALEGLAAELGVKRVVLDTNKALVEAHALYRKRGYREIARYNDNPYAHHWFGKDI